MELENNLNIVLTGMPGAGKSYIGEKLAKLLAHFTFIDTDVEIERSAGKSISEIFEQEGEDYFRELETEVVERICESRNQIVSIGGGAFQSSKNISNLKKSGLIFYLKASPKELYERIKAESHRPLIQVENPLKSLEKIFKSREGNFLKADFIIDTEAKQAYTILNDILSEYENYVKQRNFC